MRKKHVLLIYGLLIFSSTVFSQESKFKALFMYNFTKYLEWPIDKQKGDFVIGIYGSSDITQELKIIAEKKKVGLQSIIIKEMNSSSNLSICNILYVPENQSSNIVSISSNCSGKGIVIITDKPGMAKTTSGLNYVKVDGKQSFEINKSNLENCGIKVNSALLSLGIVIQ